MEGRWTDQQARTGPVRPPRPSHSLDYVGPSPRATPRPSIDLTSTSKSRKSITNSRGGSRLQEQLSPGSNDTSFRWSGADSSTGSERKRTFKKAVRKLFGRRSKEEPAQEPAPRSVPPGHGYHRSDPGQFFGPLAPPVQPLRQNPPPPLSPRVFSLPPQLPESPILRVRSPNAIQFPKSAQLKPLDLRSPLLRSDHEPRRRATLPTLNLANIAVREDESVAIGTALGSPPDSGMGGMGPDLFLGVPESEIGLAVTSTPKSEKRRSRSTNDLRQTTMMQQTPARKRSEEIKFWRESFAGTALLHPNTPPQKPEDVDRLDLPFDNESVTPLPARSESVPAIMTGRGSTAPSEGRASSALFGPSRPVTAGAERTDDLERRVAHLETSLQEFQFSLERLTINSRSRTNTLSPAPRPQVRRQHTPSILVDTLQNPSWRPASLDEFPEDLRYEDAGEVVEREWGSSGTQTPLEVATHRSRTAGESTSDSGMFTALFNMFTDERASRLRLENQVQSLQREVSTMATRLERGSWNSYSAVPLPPRTPEQSERGDSSHGAYRIVSRFSGTDSVAESEIYGLANSRNTHRTDLGLVEEVRTPFEVYRTPMEEANQYPFRENGDNEMF